jgi:hypothetical protein
MPARVSLASRDFARSLQFSLLRFCRVVLVELGGLMRRQICKRRATSAMALRDLNHTSRCDSGLVSRSSQPGRREGRFHMRRIVLISALLLVSASAQAGQFRNLSVAGAGSRPIAAPLPPAKVAEVPPAAVTSPAPVAAPAPVAPAPAVTAAPEPPPPPVAVAPVPPPLPPAATAPAVDPPKYVERPTVAPVTSDTPKVDDGKPSRRAERRHHGGGYWSAGRIMGELRRYGYGYGYGGW